MNHNKEEIPPHIQERMLREIHKKMFSKIGSNEMFSSFQGWVRCGCPNVEAVNKMIW